MTEIAALILIVASISATVIMCLHKWGVGEWYYVHRKKWMTSQLCEFCIGFWSSVVITVIAIRIFYISNILYIIVPFGAASITTLILSIARGRH